ncbi:MAG TPA: SCO family protein [Rhodocyclaceae bacterium]|nr:SCO family protein [Rhodocyclaceae bacterium]
MRIFLFLTSLFVNFFMLASAVQAHDHAAMLAMQNESTLPGESLHRLAFPLTDQQGKSFHLADEHGPATIVTMFYGDCQIACPIAIENVKRTIDALPVAQRKQVRALMISLNPGVDTAASLAKLAKLHELSPSQFRLAVAANDTQTRQLAASLGIKYRRAANGEINHSTRFVAVDSHGLIVGSSEQLSVEPDPKLLAAIAQTLP